MDEIQMKPIEIFEWLRDKLTGQSMQYPEHCATCGLKTEGNRITSYYLPCERYYWAHEFHHLVKYHGVPKSK